MKLSAGMDVDIYCTKCQANAVGAINAMVGDQIVQVTCKICGSGPKNFRPAKGKPDPNAAPSGKTKFKEQTPAKVKAAKAARPLRDASAPKPRASRSTVDPAAADLALWQVKRDESGGVASTYEIQRTYQVGEALKHPSWGLGFVMGVQGGAKMDVLFESGRKLLVMAWRK